MNIACIDQASSKVYLDIFVILRFVLGTICPHYLIIIATLESQQNLVMEMLKPLLYCAVLYLQFLQEDV